MNYRIVFHSEVYEDYKEAYTFYEAKQEGLGERFLAALEKKIEKILSSPEIFGEKSKRGYREAKVDAFPYAIVFKIYKQQKTILVNSIHHEKKHPRKKYRK
jgi:mRNA-degrading endonuclease RelE of RelBE toxin-antitoxin system